MACILPAGVVSFIKEGKAAHSLTLSLYKVSLAML